MSIEEIRAAWERLGTQKVPGSSIRAGTAYHEVPFADLDLPTHRSSLDLRVKLITDQMSTQGLSVQDKYGLDLGCSVGGLTFSFCIAGAKQVVGVDYDPQAIDVARKIEDHYQTGAVFMEKTLSLATLPTIIEVARNPASGRIDFLMWFSNFMWVLKQQGVEHAAKFLQELAACTDVMFFESSQGDFKAGKAMRKINLTTGAAMGEFLARNTPYQQIINLGNVQDGWAERDVFFCHDPMDEAGFRQSLNYWALIEGRRRDCRSARELLQRSTLRMILF